MSCTFEDAFMVNLLDESMDDENDSTIQQQTHSPTDQIQQLKELMLNEPEVNEARVLYFKAEIDSGNYQADGQAIARKMLQNTEID